MVRDQEFPANAQTSETRPLAESPSVLEEVTKGSDATMPDEVLKEVHVLTGRAHRRLWQTSPRSEFSGVDATGNRVQMQSADRAVGRSLFCRYSELIEAKFDLWAYLNFESDPGGVGVFLKELHLEGSMLYLGTLGWTIVVPGGVFLDHWRELVGVGRVVNVIDLDPGWRIFVDQDGLGVYACSSSFFERHRLSRLPLVSAPHSPDLLSLSLWQTP